MSNELSITEELDFHYLLGLMPPLHDEIEFAWLPELFSIVGHESLIKLCKFAGGETIKVPTLEELSKSIDALQWFYNAEICKRNSYSEVPIELVTLVNKIRKLYYA